MKKITQITLIVGILTILTHSTECFGSDKKNIYTKTWSLVELSEEDIAPKVGTFILSFNPSDNKFSGMAECNRYFGRYNNTRNNLSFEYVSCTRMMCPDQAVESKYIELLNKVDSYSIKRNTLRLRSKGKVILVFKIANK